MTVSGRTHGLGSGVAATEKALAHQPEAIAQERRRRYYERALRQRLVEPSPLRYTWRTPTGEEVEQRLFRTAEERDAYIRLCAGAGKGEG